MMKKYFELIDYIKSLETDAQKFYDKGQSAAGTRFRKGMSEVKKMAQDIRNEVQEIKANRKEGK
ncbi:MAG: histone H1 [Chlorobi bacterium]|nr:histone H1 [Chlorobiota bacterium]